MTLHKIHVMLINLLALRKIPEKFLEEESQSPRNFCDHKSHKSRNFCGHKSDHEPNSVK